jgi:tetratricopeptide (TPR) repeat protein
LAIDRVEALKKAEKLLRQGKLDLAIGEYVRMVDEQPRDWNTRNMLGDLYVRGGQFDMAAAQFQQIADHLFNEGFFPKAAALYKKILKIKPDDESVQLRLAEISATQGLLADAKAYFTVVASKRNVRGDRAGSDEIIIRLGSLDPADFEARALAAQTLERNGDTAAAALQYRSMHADLVEKGRPEEAIKALREAVRLNHDDLEGRGELARAAIAQGDLDTAKSYLDRELAGTEPALLVPLMEIELRSGNIEAAREILAQLLRIDPAVEPQIVDVAWRLAPSAPDAAFVCIETAADAEVTAGHYAEAAALLQELISRAPGHIGALLRLVEICVDGSLDAALHQAQADLADAYLQRGQGAEARVIAEDLVAHEPWEHAHIERFRKALVMLDVPDPDTVIADRLSGQGPFMSTDPFVVPEIFDDLNADPAESPVAAAPPAASDPEPPPAAEPQPAPTEAAAAAEPDIPLRPRIAEPDIPLRPRAAEPDIPLRPRVTEPDIPLRPRPAEPDIALRPRSAEPDIPLKPLTPEPDIALRPRSAEPDIPLRPRTPEPDIPLRPRSAEPDIPLRPLAADPPAAAKPGDLAIDLTGVLAEMEGIAAAPTPQAPPPAQPAEPPPQTLDAVFNEFRSEITKQSGTSEAAEYLGLGKTYLEVGMPDEAISALTTAARAPVCRFEAASLLGRLYMKRSDSAHAIEWLERAAEAPAPGVNEARELLYDLGSLLESSGETSRALAVFLELQADAADYRDVPRRIERLERVQAGG